MPKQPSEHCISVSSGTRAEPQDLSPTKEWQNAKASLWWHSQPQSLQAGMLTNVAQHCIFVQLGTGNARSPLAPCTTALPKTLQTLGKLRTLVVAQTAILTYAIGQQCEPIATRPRSYRMQAGPCIEKNSMTTDSHAHSRDHITRVFLVTVTPVLLNPKGTVNEVRNTNYQT